MPDDMPTKPQSLSQLECCIDVTQLGLMVHMAAGTACRSPRAPAVSDLQLRADFPCSRPTWDLSCLTSPYTHSLIPLPLAARHSRLVERAHRRFLDACRTSVANEHPHSRSLFIVALIYNSTKMKAQAWVGEKSGIWIFYRRVDVTRCLTDLFYWR
jgi:hypothetical protein